MPQDRQSRSQTFTVPGSAGQYAPEVLYLNASNSNPSQNRVAFDEVNEAQAYVTALPAGASLEIDLLKPNGDPTSSGDWRTAVASYTATGLQTILALASWYGVRVRAKSGGTGGAAGLDMSWW